MAAGAWTLSEMILGEGGGVRAARKPSELRLRTFSALALGAVALSVAWFGSWPVAAFWLAAGIAVWLEWLAMARVAPAPPMPLIGALGIAAAMTAVVAGSAPAALGALGASALGLAAVAADGRARAWALGGLAYSAAVALVPVAVRLDPVGGAFGLFWMFAAVWSTDVAAYFVGRRIGGPKLWPAVSPGKTWSGFAGGAAAGTAAGLALAWLADHFGYPLPGGWAAIALASLLASLASQAGDLGESAMKRRFGVKDSGALIPGHGGAMDRLDGFAAVALLLGVALAMAEFGVGQAKP